MPSDCVRRFARRRYSNEEVARYLVDTGLRTLRGCVFLDHHGTKMIYQRGAARCIPLAECGLGYGERFTFYDQVHAPQLEARAHAYASGAGTR